MDSPYTKDSHQEPSELEDRTPTDGNDNTGNSEDTPATPREDPVQLTLSHLELERFSFDEMNIVEHPIGLLSNRTKGYVEFPLSPDGQTKLVCPENPYGFPNHLADPTILGLMWLTMVQNNFESPTVKFKLRDFVKNFVFPERYTGNNAVSPNTINAIDKQINSIAFTRIISKNWWNKNEGRTVEVNAAVIDSVQTSPKSSGRQTEITVTWGKEFYESVRSKYTKSLNPAIYMKLSRPLDRRLFRWLDRQLGTKNRQHIRSCYEFARFKLLMTDKKIENPSMRASNFIVKLLSESIGRMDNLGFSVRLVVDTSTEDFSLTFIRTDKDKNEVVSASNVLDLINLFHELSFGSPYSVRPGKRQIPDPDRALADLWIEQYGISQCKWMVKRCLEIQKGRGGEKILLFRGLSMYEHAAAGDYKNQHDKASKDKHDTFEKDQHQHHETAWKEYRASKLNEATASLSGEKKNQLLEEARKSVASATPTLAGNQNLIRIGHEELMLKAIGAKTKEEFLATAV